MNSRRVMCVLVGAWVALLAIPAHAQPANKEVADQIIAIVKASWAADAKKNTPEAMKNVSDDYTEFNPDFATRLDGKGIATRVSEAGNKDSSKLLLSEMANEKVQVYGDVAILTYNFVWMVQDKDGKTNPTRAKSTRVYAKQAGKWMLVHANFGADPLPK